jgi:hypothetical protein
MDSRLNFVDLLLTDLKLETEIEDSYEEAEMFVIALFRKPTSKYGGSDEQRPHRLHQRYERRTIVCSASTLFPSKASSESLLPLLPEASSESSLLLSSVV